jgi:hypothetical protein
MHVICRVDGRYVEVQVRTIYQDTVAQILEKMGDWFGRQIRYGEPPTDPDSPFTTNGTQTRQELFDNMLGLAWDF